MVRARQDSGSTGLMPITAHRTFYVTGQVQGVGFRPFVYRIANELGVRGAVWNDQRGVTIDAWASDEELDSLQTQLRSEAPSLATVESVRCLEQDRHACTHDGFTIRPSDQTTTERGRITADSAVCADCAAEMFDRHDRRYRHALINCTNCGPRYSIVRDLPYDRPRTTMAAFDMCPSCLDEYTDPCDRRFHAQPTCCPDCGPQLTLLNAQGDRIPGDPIAEAAAVISAGGTLAMKGLGGYHLVVDATDVRAVETLRRRKRRDHKPFAIMVRSMDRAASLVRLSNEARAMLESPACPIVVAPMTGHMGTSHRGICRLVAPGCHRLGVMLPYTPLQHLLLAEPALRDAVLVMTSANLSDDPLVSEDRDAFSRLSGIGDAYLLHDRPIERAVDDSIVLDAGSGILPLRRARGFVPEPIALPFAAAEPGLCTGAELKNAIAIVRGAQAVLSQHIGDLAWSLAYRRFQQTIEDLQRLLDCDIRWVACDMHPRYASHGFARKLAAAAGIDLIQVQHHHAHLASLLAEHGRSNRIIGLVCDGVGYGHDGEAWGGEILIGDLAGYARTGCLRPLRLPGGDAAARRIGRCGVSWLHDAMGGERLDDHPLAHRALCDHDERRLVLRLLASGRHCPPSSGMGRLFDAAASILGVCDENHYEAMSGMLLESAAAASRRAPAGDGVLALTGGAPGPIELDHRPLLLRLVDMMDAGASTSDIAWFFHDALADGLVRGAMRVADRCGITTIGLSGGVFCNELLTRRVRDRLEPMGYEVLVHQVVPPNDGGLALGQAAVAVAALSAKKEG